MFHYYYSLFVSDTVEFINVIGNIVVQYLYVYSTVVLK